MSLSSAPPPRRAVGETVYQAIVDLHNQGMVASRQVIVGLTSLTYGVVDDHIKRMLEDGRLRRVAPGIVQPVEVLPPAQAISLTVLPNGMAKLEVGDVLLNLNPSDRRNIGNLFAGSASELANQQSTRDLIDTIADLRRSLQAAHKQMAKQGEAIRMLQRIPRQAELPLLQ